MTTSTSRSASAAPTASSCPGRKRSNPNSSCSAPCGSVARATGSGGGGPRPGRARVEAASMGRRTLPPAPAGSGIGVRDLLQIVDDYLAELTRRMQEILGAELLAVYAGGSYALGAYEHGPQRHRRDRGGRRPALARDEAGARRRAPPRGAPVPRRGLELVVYPRATTQVAHRGPGLRAQPQHRRGMDFRADLAPATSRASGSRSTARSCASTGSRCTAPPTAELLAPIPRAHARPAARGVDPLASRRRLGRRRSSTSPAAATSSPPALDLEARRAAAA